MVEEIEIEHNSENCFSAVKLFFFRLIIHRPTAEDQDKGTAWVVLFWSVISNFLNTGLIYGTYGTINIALQQEFKISITESSFICGLNSFLFLVVAPAASILTKQLSCRVVQVSGGVMALIGLGGCAFANQVWQVYVLYGVIAGLGVSCCYMAVPGVLVHHFRQRKYLAFAVTNLGNLTGAMTWSSLSQLMFSSFGFSLTMGILGLLEILLIMAGVVMTEQVSLEEEPLKVTTTAISRSQDNEEIEAEVKSGCEEPEIEKTVADPQEISEKKFDVKGGLRMLLTDWPTWWFIINFAFWNITVNGFLIFINDYVVTYSGISKSAAALGVTIYGAGAVTGNMINIAIAKVEFDRLYLHAPMSALYGGCTILLAFTNGKVMFYVLTFFWGLAHGLQVANLFATCYTFHGAQLLNILFAINVFAQSLTGLATAPICSYLQTRIHYTAGLSFAGATGIIASIPLIPVMIKRSRTRNSTPSLT